MVSLQLARTKQQTSSSSGSSDAISVMPAKQQTPPEHKQSKASSFIPQMPVFPPLPPLPPPDTCMSPKTTRKATTASVDPRPRLFGVKITNLLGVRDGSPNAPDHKSPRSLAMAAAQRYYHQYQYHSHSGKKAQSAKEESTNEKERSLPVRGTAVSTAQYCSKRSPMQPGRTIWSVTPEELAELAKEIAATKADPTEVGRKLTYAEASKRNLPGSVDDRAAQKTEVTVVDQPVRVFKKYYGLPNIPSYDPSDRDTLETKDPSEEPAGPFSKNVSPSPAYSQLLGLSADTPTFYPRQTDTNNVIRVTLGLHSQLKASLTSKKVAPHMDWWPGDWKCTNCGNHVLFPKLDRTFGGLLIVLFLEIQNFSYRDSCKRCRVGRLEDAGFVFPPSSTSTESSA